MKRRLAGLLVALVASAVHGQSEPAVIRLDAAVYDRAARFLPDQQGVLVRNAQVAPHWRAGPREGFTYRRELGDGRAEFVFVDAATGSRRAAFDAEVVAAGLKKAGMEGVAADRLPFADFQQTRPDALTFDAGGRRWTCATTRPACDGVAIATPDPVVVLSPDRRWAAFVKDGNLWVRSSDGGTSFALTTDGGPGFAYGAMPDDSFLVRQFAMRGLPLPPDLLWSPDSRHVFANKLDQRGVREVTLQASVPLAGGKYPESYRWHYAFPGDRTVPQAESWLFDIASRGGRKLDVPPFGDASATPIQGKRVWWSDDGRVLNLLHVTRYSKTMSLYAVDADSGATRRIVGESGKTFVEPAAIGQRPMVARLPSGDYLWFSERDGFGRLYVYTADGRQKRVLTAGPWSVRSIVAVDSAHDRVYVEGVGRERGDDPYFRRVYAIALGSGRTTLLTPERADHDVIARQKSAYEPPVAPDDSADSHLGFAPSGRYFVETYSRLDLPPVSVLRRADGTRIADIETADVAGLKAGGFTPPERFAALAADGRTMVYGNILRPSDFDPAKRYPVIDNIYPGPQIQRASPGFMAGVFDLAGGQELAELGFIVIAMDGRGTPGRDKAFHDLSYGPLFQTGHVDDHIAAIRALAERYPQMDLGRVGVVGSSSGGYAAMYALLTYPDFYRVGVADAGPHDSRIGLAGFIENYAGPLTDKQLADIDNAALAPRLKGKLLLTHGGLDYNVLPDQTYRMADALIRAGKDFDLVIAPGAGHAPAVARGYVMQRVWDFLVRNLQGVEPPGDYDLSKPPGK